MAHQLHEQPSRVAARARGVIQREFRGLHARFHADQVSDVLAQTLVQCHQKIDGRQRCAVDARQVGRELRRQRQCGEVRRQLPLLFAGVDKGDLFRVRLKEKVERVEHCHFGNKIDFDPQLIGFLGEDQAR